MDIFVQFYFVAQVSTIDNKGYVERSHFVTWHSDCHVTKWSMSLGHC